MEILPSSSASTNNFGSVPNLGSTTTSSPGSLLAGKPNPFASAEPPLAAVRPDNENPYAAPATPSVEEPEGGDQLHDERQRLIKVANGYRFFSICYLGFLAFVCAGFLGYYDFACFALFPFLGMWLATLGMLNRSSNPVVSAFLIVAAFIPCFCILPMICSVLIARVDLNNNGIPIGVFGPPRKYIDNLEAGGELAPAKSQQELPLVVYFIFAFMAFIAGITFFV